MATAYLEALSPLAQQILGNNPHAYERLVVRDGTSSATQALLGHVTPEQLFAAPIKSSGYALAALAGLWLWHDALDESHRIAQQSPQEPGASSRQLQEMTETLAYWHAIMHRREGDFSNSKYWLARCRNHPVSAAISAGLPDVIKEFAGESTNLSKAKWDPGELVDQAEQIHLSPSARLYPLIVAVQRLEWNCLFAYCVQAAAPLPA